MAFVTRIKNLLKRLEDRKWYSVLKKIYERYKEDEVPALSAQITYYLVLSLFPFLIFLSALASYLPIDGNKVMDDLSRLIPPYIISLIKGIVGEILETRSTALLSFSMLGTLWASSKGISSIIRGLNKAFDEEEKRPFWKLAPLSLLFTVVFAVGILFSIILLVFGEVIGRNLFRNLGISLSFERTWDLIRLVASVLLLLLVFIALYYLMPNRRMKIRQTIPGALFATLGWLIVSLVFSIYVNNFNYFSVTYGSIGGIILLLIWLYWISMLVLMGGEVNAAIHL